MEGTCNETSLLGVGCMEHMAQKLLHIIASGELLSRHVRLVHENHHYHYHHHLHHHHRYLPHRLLPRSKGFCVLLRRARFNVQLDFWVSLRRTRVEIVEPLKFCEAVIYGICCD